MGILKSTTRKASASLKETRAAFNAKADKTLRQQVAYRLQNDNTLADMALEKSNDEIWDFDKEWARA